MGELILRNIFLPKAFSSMKQLTKSATIFRFERSQDYILLSFFSFFFFARAKQGNCATCKRCTLHCVSLNKEETYSDLCANHVLSFVAAISLFVGGFCVFLSGDRLTAAN